MKLYELKRGDKFKISGHDEVFTFHKIDGMYSICYLNGEIVHLSAWTPVTKVEDNVQE